MERMPEEITGLGVLRYSSGSPAVVVVRSGSRVRVSSPPSGECCIAPSVPTIDDLRVFMLSPFTCKGVIRHLTETGVCSDHGEANS